jgi:hypothetical protein
MMRIQTHCGYSMRSESKDYLTVAEHVIMIEYDQE